MVDKFDKKKNLTFDTESKPKIRIFIWYFYIYRVASQKSLRSPAVMYHSYCNVNILLFTLFPVINKKPSWISGAWSFWPEIPTRIWPKTSRGKNHRGSKSGPLFFYALILTSHFESYTVSRISTRLTWLNFYMWY
jgi:hypothetical protein